MTKLPSTLVVSFGSADLEFICECKHILAQMHPEYYWCDERVVRLAVGTLWRELTGESDVTPGEFISQGIDEPIPGEVIFQESLLDLLNKQLGDED